MTGVGNSQYNLVSATAPCGHYRSAAAGRRTPLLRSAAVNLPQLFPFITTSSSVVAPSTTATNSAPGGHANGVATVKLTVHVPGFTDSSDSVQPLTQTPCGPSPAPPT